MPAQVNNVCEYGDCVETDVHAVAALLFHCGVILVKRAEFERPALFCRAHMSQAGLEMALAVYHEDIRPTILEHGGLECSCAQVEYFDGTVSLPITLPRTLSA